MFANPHMSMATRDVAVPNAELMFLIFMAISYTEYRLTVN